MGKIEQYLQEGAKRGASDVHLAAGYPVMYRIDGELISATEEKLSEEEMKMLLQELLTDGQMGELRRQGRWDKACSISGTFRVRLHVFCQRGGYAITLRMLSTEVPDIKALGIPASVVKLTDRKSGLILVTGSAGCGRTTTLAALIQRLSYTYPRNILTLEYLSEYLYSSGKSLILQREIGKDCATCADGLRAALFEDVDVILVGKLQDAETIELAVAAAELGHLVLAEIDGGSVCGAVEHMVGIFPEYMQRRIRLRLSEALAGIACQQMIPKEGGGRAAAFEVMLTEPAIRNLIREEKYFQIPSVMQSKREAGMQTMDEAIYDLYMKSLITTENAVAYAKDTLMMERKVKLF